MLQPRMFTISALVGLGLMGFLAVAMLSISSAMPFYAGNIGGFYISGSSLDIDNFELSPDVDSNSDSSGGAMPSGVTHLKSADVVNMVLEKEFNVASVIGKTSTPTWKMRMISSAPVKLGDATLRMSGLCAQSFDAINFEADAMGANTADFRDDFVMRSEKVTISDFGLEATYMSTGSMAVSGLQLQIVPGGYEKPACAD